MLEQAPSDDVKIENSESVKCISILEQALTESHILHSENKDEEHLGKCNKRNELRHTTSLESLVAQYDNEGFLNSKNDFQSIDVISDKDLNCSKESVSCIQNIVPTVGAVGNDVICNPESSCNSVDPLISPKISSNDKDTPLLNIFEEVSALISKEIMAILSNNLLLSVEGIQGILVEHTPSNSIKIKGNLNSIVNTQSIIINLLAESGKQVQVKDKATNETCTKCCRNRLSPKRKRPRRSFQNQINPLPSSHESQDSNIGRIQTRSRTKTTEADVTPADVSEQLNEIVEVVSRQENSKPIVNDDDRNILAEALPINDGNVSAAELDETESSAHENLDCTSECDESSKALSPHDLLELKKHAKFKLSCELCSFKTNRMSQLTKHSKLHDIKDTLQCSECSFSTFSSVTLKLHQRCHSSSLLKCDLCQYFTTEKRLMMKHHINKHIRKSSKNTKRHTDMMKCSYCSYTTDKKSLFKRHQNRHQMNENEDLVSMHECKECQYKTRRKEHFIRHIANVHTDARPFLCDICGSAFKRADVLRKHCEIVHELGDNSSLKFKCNICGKLFRSMSHLKEHEIVHSEERSFLCEICGASFKTRSSQRKHIANIHNNPRAHTCLFCDKKFNTAYGVKRHVQVVHVTSETNKNTLDAIEAHKPIEEQQSTFVVTMNENQISHFLDDVVVDPLTNSDQAIQRPTETAAIINVASLNDIIVAPESAVMTEQIAQVTDGEPTAISVQDALDGAHQAHSSGFIQQASSAALIYLTTNLN